MRIWISFLLVPIGLAAATAMAAPAAPIDFAEQVYPILRRSCFECHGPDKQEGGLRLDRRLDAVAGGDGGPAWTAGDADSSKLLRRVTLAKDDPEVMPARGDLLAKRDVELLKGWIEQGAIWPEKLELAKHWAYVAPVRPRLPLVKDGDWPQTPIDHFIVARLEAEGIPPSPPVPRAELLRRVSLDLVGLPPTVQELDTYLSDPSPDAYERAVDRLLASPEFGVRWARPWLDYARYADSHGFQRDDLRSLWPYRDWVVAALNHDMPFDRFSIEQIAGDLLPRATEAQRIATGFHRSAPTNVEAGSDPEETRVNQVFDRVNTIGMVWLGSTLECCQCHDHKYDPFTQRDYYGLFAVLNNTAIEADRANPKVPGSIRFLGPQMEVRSAGSSEQRKALEAQLQIAQEALAARRKQLAKVDREWEQQLLAKVANTAREELLKIESFESLGGATHEVLEDGSVLLSGDPPEKDTYTITASSKLAGIRAIKLETLTDPSLPGEGPGRGDKERPNFVLHEFTVAVAEPDKQAFAPVKFVRARADYSQARYDVAGAIDGDAATAWAINPQFHKPHWAVFETEQSVGDGAGVTLKCELVQNYGGARTIGRLRLSAIVGELSAESVPAAIAEALAAVPAKRTPKQREALAAYRVEQDAESGRLATEVSRLTQALAKLAPPTTLVMQELPAPRASTIFQRGDFRTPGETVEPSTPEILTTRHPKQEPNSPPLDRLGLARWLVDRDNPLAARVTVNRLWAELFGRGLVATPEDFGMKGEPPTNPELLDFLAVELMEQGWSQKQLLRTIVLSSVYQQSSRITPERLAADDQNLWLGRFPRRRLAAEQIRDNALAVAGLLSHDQDGPPIQPYQPEGLWTKVGGQKYDYLVSPGGQRHRRGLYIVWKRSAPYPSFVNFDASARLACRVTLPRSNTPLQALTLLNDPVYVEAALALAARVLREQPEASDEQRLQYAFRLATARKLQAAELSTLEALLIAQRASAEANAAGTRQLLGDYAHELPPGASAAELAAWYAVATAILNLDETITQR